MNTAKDYRKMTFPETDSEIRRAIEDIRAGQGDELFILAHHYQADGVVAQADATGDSLLLSRLAATRTQARHIVFCGVHFMAETADILTRPDQAVHLPHPSAGCPMADMAALDQVEACWDALTARFGPDIIPLTYVNSSAALKDFCGRHHGTVCTSTNARAVLKWALDSADRVLFFPDQHLGRNTGLDLGLTRDQMCLWDRGQGQMVGAHPGVKVILWDGWCGVHQAFTRQDIDDVRARLAGVKVVVHPECSAEVVGAADEAGSTERIIECVTTSPPGSKWAVGTEINLVRRLAAGQRDKTIIPLSPSCPHCDQMGLITPANLLATLRGLEAADTPTRVRVPGEVAQGARLALDRMLEIS